MHKPNVTPKTAFCPSCKRVTTFVYAGEQKGLNNEAAFSLWNCRACSTTVSSPTLDDAQKRKENNVKGKMILITIGLVLIVIYAINIVNEFANSLF